MEKDWLMLFSTPDEMRASFVKNILEKEGINPVLLNKKASPYGLGEVEIYVWWQEAEKAIQIIYTIEL